VLFLAKEIFLFAEKMKVFTTILLGLAYVVGIQSRNIEFHNRCDHDVWVQPLTNAQGPPLGGGIQRLNVGGYYNYAIPNDGWGGRFWPKINCDGQGHNCEFGQSVDPCPDGGCHPPAETKVEFFFPPLNNGYDVWYDISLVDGYSLPVEIIPSVQQGTCVTTDCAVSLDRCPYNENDVGDLRINKNGRTVACLSPCKRWNYPYPFGLGLPEDQYPGVMLCCPTPPIWPEECRGGPVIHTQYVQLIHRDCPTAYSYAYDDEAGLHNCPNDVSFRVTFCH